MNRRALLSGTAIAGTSLLAAGGAGMVASRATPAVGPAAESVELQRRIEAHRQAKAAWDAASDLADVASADSGEDNAALEAAAQKAGDAEVAAFLAVLSCPVSTLADLRTMAAYAEETSWGETCPEPDEIAAFVNTILGRTA